jgi:hypothetical protein
MDKNMKFEKKIYKLLNEIGATGGIGGFVGGKGQSIDKVKDGPFYPSKEANQALKDQIKNNEDKTKFSEKITPLQDLEMVLVEMEYVFDEYPNYADKLLFINDSNDMKEVDLEIEYDAPDCGCDKSIFINDTNDYKLVEGK